jgi:hypothetical protein
VVRRLGNAQGMCHKRAAACGARLIQPRHRQLSHAQAARPAHAARLVVLARRGLHRAARARAAVSPPRHPPARARRDVRLRSTRRFGTGGLALSAVDDDVSKLSKRKGRATARDESERLKTSSRM